eukprot:1080021-Amphidinium_carterae.2
MRADFPRVVLKGWTVESVEMCVITLPHVPTKRTLKYVTLGMYSNVVDMVLVVFPTGSLQVWFELPSLEPTSASCRICSVRSSIWRLASKPTSVEPNSVDAEPQASAAKVQRVQGEDASMAKPVASAPVAQPEVQKTAQSTKATETPHPGAEGFAYALANHFIPRLRVWEDYGGSLCF